MAAFLFCVLTLSAQPLLACTGCANMGLTIEHPWAPYGLPILWTWLLALWMARSWIQRYGGGDPDEFVPRSLFRPFLWFGGTLLVLSPLVGVGGFSVPGMWAWCLFVIFVGLSCLVALLRLIWRRSIRRSSAAIALHACFAVFAFGAIDHGRNLTNSIEFNVANLDSPIWQVYSVVMPRIFEQGQAAVPALIGSVRRSLTEEEWKWRRDYTIPNAAYCLAHLGGPEAKRFLQQTIRESVDFRLPEEDHWQRSICLAGAQLLGSDARDDLMVLYERIPDHSRDVSTNRAVVLCALAMTADEEAVSFVMDHSDELVAEYDCEALIELTADTLRSGADPDALRSIPWFRLTAFTRPKAPGELSVSEFRARFLKSRKARTLKKQRGRGVPG